MQLSELQLVYVGMVASALLWVLRIAVSRGYQPNREQLAIGLYVVSFVMAILLTPAVIPPFSPFSDAPSFIAAVFQWMGDFIAAASPIAGFAYLIYNLLLKRVLDGLQARLTRKG
jgi:hypothetical protein